MDKVGVRLLTDEAHVPEKVHESDAAFDLHADRPAFIEPKRTVVVSTGIALDLPSNLYALVLSRSGLAAKKSLFVLNGPGLIDSGYRGEIKIILHNAGDRPVLISQGDRVAQLLIQEQLPIELKKVDTLSSSDRGDKGIGSTGVNRCPHTNIVQEYDGSFICARCYAEVSPRDFDRLM